MLYLLDVVPLDLLDVVPLDLLGPRLTAKCIVVFFPGDHIKQSKGRIVFKKTRLMCSNIP